MKAIMVMYDSLNRHYLPGYGGASEMDLPNFRRLNERAVSFDRSYVASMPCMPARRELHTGRYNFLHRSWGPLEPFDNSMPQLLQRNGIETCLSTDHYHYFEDGGATYHNRYGTYSSHRGQESDCWVGTVKKPESRQILSLDKLPDGFRQYRAKTGMQNMCNRQRMLRQEDYPQHKTFEDGLDFIARNRDEDNWFVQIETFDPHEPFFSPEHIQRRFFDPDSPLPAEDWPSYTRVSEEEREIEAMRNKYRALMTMCDEYLGKVLDAMDEYDLWKDTMLIVNTDHGFLLAEHGWWGKSVMPLYEEIAHTPLWIWDPRCGKRGERRQALVQTIDLAPTLLDYFGVNVPEDMQGKPLKGAIDTDAQVREYALFGYFGGTVNITDGEYVYLRAPVAQDAPLYEYTLMPTHMNSMFSPEELRGAELAPPLSFTKGCPVLKIPSIGNRQVEPAFRQGNLLYHLQSDPRQERPLEDEAQEARLLEAIRVLMRESDAPAEQYERIGL